MTTPYSDHTHEYILPASGTGLHAFLGVCRLCSAVKTWDNRQTNLPGEIGSGWVNLPIGSAVSQGWPRSGL